MALRTISAVLLAVASAIRNPELDTLSEAREGPHCDDELSNRYSFMNEVGKMDSTVFYIYGKPMAEQMKNQFFVFSSEPGKGKYGAKLDGKKRYLNYYVVKGQNCITPTKKDCVADPALFPKQSAKGSNLPGAGWYAIIGMGSGMYDTYDASAYGLGSISFSLTKEGEKMVATTSSGCVVGRVNVCEEKNGSPSIMDVYDQDGVFCSSQTVGK
eukprot:CAMPEP_0197660410 /NCGR_PEP_ID=MMETSP1338-20131121/50830_1 /TAXON_ID=43686 ORGANISM="Pelagodinium beii, Strain RCC1491" /NCGR_SAMPLE_ID=MMETSP1338 /ASSEMBLY_ACC=CAM_ASM_000754 /LENGTH=212 /DNA_ID=CAMNT_0043237753 /DNA_START=54 /DNA_END=692 /DNA_ORIENTATION=+